MITPAEAAAELAHNTFDFVAVIPEGIGGHWARADTPEEALRNAQRRTHTGRKPRRYYILRLKRTAKIDFNDWGQFWTSQGADLKVHIDKDCDVRLTKENTK